MRRMKPLLWITGLALVFSLIGWTWCELPRPVTLFAPTWTRSYQLYHQPHAVWLDQYDRVGANLPSLKRVLTAAAKARQIPELVVYAIPMRDLGQSSEGGFAKAEDYLADNRLNAELIGHFVHDTGIHPVLYLEPDSISLAVQYRRDHNEDATSRAIYAERIQLINALITLYRGVGAKIYLDAAHSGWFDYGDEDVRRIANALNEAGIARVDGLASNISNRQPVTSTISPKTKALSPVTSANHTEFHYLSRLLLLLDNPHLDVRVDTSRNGGPTQARKYYLSPQGQLIDNENPQGRLVGFWESLPASSPTPPSTIDADKQPTPLPRQSEAHPQASPASATLGLENDILLKPFHGKTKRMSRLVAKEKFTYDATRRILSAPPWLDAVGDVQLGPAPTDTPPAELKTVIQHYRYIKPPDDCDGTLNCPPGASKHDINRDTATRQPIEPLHLPAFLWFHSSTH